MSNKQTSIEWLIDQLEKHYVKTDLKNTVVYQQAKAMHKEEIIDAYDTAYMRVDSYTRPEQYYQETYNK